MDASRTSVAVIGGGIAGLTATYRLLDAGVPAVLLERDRRVGGKIVTDRRDGCIVEGGPDTFMAAKPAGRALCDELGVPLTAVADVQHRAFVMRGGRLWPLPAEMTGLAPPRLGALMRSPLIGRLGALRMAAERFVPARRDDADESLAGFVRRRLGARAWDRLLEPLVTGVYAGDGDTLSVGATFPSLRESERAHGSLSRAARRAPARVAAPAFLSPEGGMGSLVDALRQRIGPAIRVACAVDAIERDGDGYRVLLTDGSRLYASGVVVATPAHEAAPILRSLHPALAGELETIPHVSTAVVVLAFGDHAGAARFDAHGYVIPRCEGSPIVAIAVASRKFPDRCTPGLTLVRGFVGRAGEPDPLERSDGDLVACVRAEVGRTLGLTGAPIRTEVHRWPAALPQYPIGHLDRLATIDRLLADLPGLALAGQSYRGLGIPDCIASGEAAVARVKEALTAGRL